MIWFSTEGAILSTGLPAKSLTLPPPPDTPPDMEAIAASMKAYGTVTLGPPPGL